MLSLSKLSWWRTLSLLVAWGFFAFSALCGVLSAAPNQHGIAHRGVPTIHQLTEASGYIFVGIVKSIVPVGAGSANQVEAMQITFHVENAIRGVNAGQTLVIREWAGLWNSGEHYRIGEKLMLFLFRPGKLGLTSPVGGPLGKFEIDAYNQVLLNQQHAAVISQDPALADRWRGKDRIPLREFSNAIRSPALEREAW